MDQLKTEKSFLEKELVQRKSTWEQEKLSLEQELEQMRSTWEQDKLSLELELEQIKSTWEQEKSSLERDFERRESAWQLEKEELIQEKDSEKRQAILHVQEQAEQEYKQFLEEHSDTLNRALSTAREQHDYEMVGAKSLRLVYM